MKKLQQLSPLFIKKSCLVLTGILIAMVSYSVLSAILWKNTYQLTGNYDETAYKYNLTLTVDQPKNEEVTLQAEDEALVSIEMFENFKSDAVEVLPPTKETEKGVRLKVKASNKKVQVTLPITLSEGQKSKVQLKRSGKIIASQSIVATEMNKKTQENSLAQASTNSLMDFAPNNLTNSFLPLDNRANGAGKTVIVHNYAELLAAFKDATVTKIEFGADIIQSNYTKKNMLPVLTRSLTIDGKGHQLKISYSQSNLPAFRLGDTKRSTAVFELVNIHYNLTKGTGRETPLINSENANQSQFWTIKVSNLQKNYSGANPENLIYLPKGKVEIRGQLHWDSSSAILDPRYKNGIINAAQILITDGADVDLKSHNVNLRLNPSDNDISTALVINKGAQVKLFSWNYQAIWMNREGATNEVIFEVADEGTAVHCSSKGTFYGADGGVITIQGQRNESKNRYSRTEILRGATLTAEALSTGTVSNEGYSKTTSAFVNQVSGGSIFNVDGGAKVTLKGEGEAHSFCSVLRMRLVGEQQFTVSNNAELTIVKELGIAAAVRMYGKDNRFIVKSGGKLTVKNNELRGEAADGGDTGGRQGIQFTVDGGGTSYFEAADAKSSIYVYAGLGPALESLSGSFSFNVGKEATFRMEGTTKSANQGIVQGKGETKVTIDEPAFYDFRNNRKNGGQAFATGNSQNQTFTSKNVGLAVWEKRAGVDVNGNPDNFWNPLDYVLKGSNFNTIASTNVPNEFNTQTFKGGSAYTRITGNNYRPVVRELHIPTNADKHIYGQVVVPYELDGSVREAWEREVWVELQLLDVNGKEKARQWVSTHGKNDILPGISIYGGKARGGVFDWELANFLQAGETVRVLNALRGDYRNPDSAKNIVSLPEDIKVTPVTVQDVTPPTSLKVEHEQATDTLKQIKGTIDLFDQRDQKMQEEVYIFAKTAQGYLKNGNGDNYFKVTAATESVSEGSSVKKWVFNLPAYLNADKDQYVEIFAKDTIDGEPKFSSDPPITLTTEPNDQLGNLTPSAISQAKNKEYHDAVGSESFASSVYLPITKAAPATPEIRLEIPQSFDRDEDGKPIIAEGNQFDFRVTVISGDARDSGKDPVKNLEITLSKSAYLAYFNLDQLAHHEEIAAMDSSGDVIKIKLKHDLAAGERISFTLTAKVNSVPEQATSIKTTATVAGESSLEDPFIVGPPNAANSHLILRNQTSIEIKTGTRAALGESVYLSVVNQQLHIFYANTEELSVYIDGTHYQDFKVKNRRVTESLTLEIPISEIRNHVSVKYKDLETGKEKVAYWNNHWEFMN